MKILFRQERIYYILISVVVVLFVFRENAAGQFHRDSLQAERATGTFRQIPLEIVKSIARGNFKKPGWNEYFPVNGMELPQVYPAEAEQHPRLISDHQLHQARLNITRFPYRAWYGALQQMAERNAKYSSAGNGTVQQMAEFLKTETFLYQIDKNPVYLQSAVEKLTLLPEPPSIENWEGGKSGSGWGDYLQSAMALPPLCLALDLLYDDLNPKLLLETRRKILAITGQLLNGVRYSTYNNHTAVMSVAILTVALVENRPDELIPYTRREVWETGLRYLSRSLSLVAPDGGYAEGVYYARFILNYLASFSIYFQNNTGVQLFRHPVLQRMALWVEANEKGTGSHSSFDDAYQTEFFYLPLISHELSFQTEWQTSMADDFLKPHPNMVEAICNYRPSPAAASAPEAIQFFYESGQVIFRDRAHQPNIFVSFLAEREEWFADRHEHIDPLNFELSALGQDFIVEGGYGTGVSDRNRDWFTSSYAHNGILVDGMGTYRNPVWGDSLSGRLQHAFHTGDIAAATVSHGIGDVRIQRKVYFINRELVFMLDRVAGEEHHDIALNFNYLGRFRQKSPREIQIIKDGAQLNIAFFNNTSRSPVITSDFGLFTSGNGPSPTNRMIVELPEIRSGNILSILIPSPAGSQLAYEKIPAKNGGQIWRLSPVFSGFENEYEWATNPGGVLSTDRWQTDAAAVWMQYDPAGQISGFLLVEVTEFRSGELALRCEIPVSILLERKDTRWLGYVESRESGPPVKLQLSGFPVHPLHFNYRIQKPLPSGNPEFFEITLSGSGALSLGMGPHWVSVPQRHYPSRDFLVWLNRQSATTGQNYDYWSDYRKQQFQNQITFHLVQGFNQAIRSFSTEWTDHPGTFSGAVNLMGGLMQESYNHQNFDTWRLPHRFRFGQQESGWQWQILEEGVFTERDIQVRHLNIQTGFDNNRQLIYRLQRGFENHESHYLRVHTGNADWLLFQTSRAASRRNYQAQWHLQNERLMVNPGMQWRNDGKSERAFVHWQSGQTGGYLQYSAIEGRTHYYQALSSTGNGWGVSVEGEHVPVLNQQQYRTNGWLAPDPSLRFGYGLYLKNINDWEVPYSFAEMNWFSRNLNGRFSLEKNQRDIFQRMGFYIAGNRRSAAINFRFRNFRFDEQSMLQWEWQHTPDGQIWFYTRGDYRYDPIRRQYRNQMWQNLSVPLSEQFLLQPVLGEVFPGKDVIAWLGSGFSYFSEHVWSGQFLINRQVRPVGLDYQFSGILPGFLDDAGIIFWLHLYQSGDILQSAEIRLQHAAALWQPGIYYAFTRNQGIRWEGFIEWRW